MRRQEVPQGRYTLVFLGADDLSKLWTAMQARYRPSMAYSVSVVLIQSQAGARSPLPVLKRGADDRGPIAQGAPAPVLTGARAAASPLLPAIRLGEDLLVNGANLSRGSFGARFEHPRLGIVHDLVATPVNASQLSLRLPSVATGIDTWAVGVYSLVLRVTEPLLPAWGTNSVPVALAPLISVAPLTHASGTVNLSVSCTPRIRAAQESQVRLLFGVTEVLPSAISTPANTALPTTLTFAIPGVKAGDHVVRLRVDGVDSLPVTYAGTPPRFEFDPQQTVVVT